MAVRIDRRGFFRGIAGTPAPQRPPWALPEDQFTSACDGCGTCIGACPKAILVPAAGGLPRIDFSRGGCTFCGQCVEACDRKAFAARASHAAWELSAWISPACLEPQGITCRVCETACDEAALRFRPMTGGRARVIVDSDRCTGCGACVAACPVDAIRIAGQIAETAPPPGQKETVA
jgi:ferredoxin-type protein NapF